VSQDEFIDMLMRLVPGLPSDVARRLSHHYRFEHPVHILANTDEELLSRRNFGPKYLAAFRAVWPTPVVDGWAEHAAMVAVV
jgi:hypothetical protein